MPTRSIASYGAKADGITDDSVAFQRCANATRPGDIFALGKGKRYRVTKQIFFQASDVQIWGYDSPIISDTSVSPDNRPIVIGTPGYNNPSSLYAFVPQTNNDGQVNEGWQKFLRPLDTAIYLMMGVDPADEHEEHFGMFLPKGTTQYYVPYDIKGTTAENGMKVFSYVKLPASTLRPSGYVERVHIRDLRFEQVRDFDGIIERVTDAHLWISGAKHVTIDGLRGDVTIGVQLADVDHVMIRNVDVNLIYNHGASGRAVSMWNTSNYDIDGVRIVGNDLPPRTSRGFFIESHCRNGRIDNVEARYNMQGRGWGDTVGLIHYTGYSTGLSVGHIKITDPSLIDICSSGGIPNEQPQFDVVEAYGVTDLVTSYRDKGWIKFRKLIIGPYPG